MRIKRIRLAVVLAAAVTALAFGFTLRGAAQAPPVNPLENTADAHLARAHDAFQNHRLQEAEREFRAALALNPNLTVQARFPLAVVLFELQDVNGARSEFEKVRARTGDDPNLNYYLGRLDLMEADLPSAIHNLTLAAANPPFPDTDLYLGFGYLKEKNYPAAEKWLSREARLAPRDARTHEHLGLLYQEIGHKRDANREFALAASLREQDVFATENALDCGRALDDAPLEEAKKTCEKLDDPEDLGSLVSLGTLYGRHHDYLAALAPFRMAVKLDPDSYEMQYNLGLTYFRLERYAEACPPLEAAAALRPDLFEVNAPLGAALFALGNDEAAYPVLNHAHRLNPANTDIAALLARSALNLAIECLRNRQPEKTRTYLAEASAADPANAQIHLQIAKVFDAMGNAAAAERERSLAAAGPAAE